MRARLIPLLALSCLMAAEDLGTLLQRARMARDAGRLADALQAYDAMLAQVPLHETAMLERAQTLSWAGRFAEALAAYRAFKTAFPSRGQLADLRVAQVLAWDGRTSEASAALAPWVARGDRQALLDEATYLGWGSRWNEATAHYQALLGRDAGDAEARLGLARLALWRGHPAEARRHLEALSPAERALLEAKLLEAQLLSAEGHPAQARAALRPLLASRSAQREARRMMADLIDGQGLWAELAAHDTTTSEGLETDSLGLRARLPLGEGAFSLAAGRTATRFRDLARHRGAFEVGFATPLGATLGLEASLVHGTGDGGSTTGYRAGLGWRPGSGLSLRADASQSPLDFTPAAIDQGHRLRSQEISAGWTFGQGRNSLGLGTGWGQLSAGSTRRTFLARFEHRMPFAGGELRGGALWRGFGYSETLPLGFFNPERYRYAGLSGAVALRRAGRWETSLDAQAGRQTVNSGAAQTAWGWSLRGQYRFERLPLALEAGWSESHAGLPVMDPVDPAAYQERTFRVAMRLTQPVR